MSFQTIYANYSAKSVDWKSGISEFYSSLQHLHFIQKGTNLLTFLSLNIFIYEMEETDLSYVLCKVFLCAIVCI
jgi:hypothetical protein